MMDGLGVYVYQLDLICMKCSSSTLVELNLINTSLPQQAKYSSFHAVKHIHHTFASGVTFRKF